MLTSIGKRVPLTLIFSNNGALLIVVVREVKKKLAERVQGESKSSSVEVKALVKKRTSSFLASALPASSYKGVFSAVHIVAAPLR